MLDGIADRVVAALVGGPVRAVIGGALVLAALVRWLGWWSIAVLVGAAAVDMARWPRPWRPW